MFGKQRKLPGCIGFVDFEHWYISLERQYGVKPDIKGWKAELEKNYDVEEIAVFGDFSNPGLRGELDKIRDVTPMVILKIRVSIIKRILRTLSCLIIFIRRR